MTARPDERLLKLADAVEFGIPQRDIGFNMAHTYEVAAQVPGGDLSGRGCGFVCCIAGFTNILFGFPNSPFLGLSEKEVVAPLFMPPKYSDSPTLYTAKRAAAVIRHLAHTGRVEWDRFDRKGNEIDAKKSEKSPKQTGARKARKSGRSEAPDR